MCNSEKVTPSAALEGPPFAFCRLPEAAQAESAGVTGAGPGLAAGNTHGWRKE